MMNTLSNAERRLGRGSLLSAALRPASVEARLLALAVTVGALLYIVFFSGIAPVHDATHEIRHAILSVPCH